MPMESSNNIFILGKQYKTPFSRGILAHRLTRLGIPLNNGHNLANNIYRYLRRKKVSEIEEEEFIDLVKGQLEKNFGSEIAQKYVLLEKWSESQQPLIILISGAPGVGKGLIAREIAFRLDIYRNFETSLLLNISQKVISESLAPELYYPSYLAWKALRPIHSALFDKVIIGFEEQVKILKAGIQAMINRAWLEKTSFILRGEHLVPQIIDKEMRDNPNILLVTLFLEDSEEHLNRILEEKRITKNTKEYFQNIRKIHDYLVESAEVMGVPIIENTNSSETVNRIFELCMNKIEKLLK